MHFSNIYNPGDCITFFRFVFGVFSAVCVCVAHSRFSFFNASHTLYGEKERVPAARASLCSWLWGHSKNKNQKLFRGVCKAARSSGKFQSHWIDNPMNTCGDRQQKITFVFFQNVHLISVIMTRYRSVISHRSWRLNMCCEWELADKFIDIWCYIWCHNRLSLWTCQVWDGKTPVSMQNWTDGRISQVLISLKKDIFSVKIIIIRVMDFTFF